MTDSRDRGIRQSAFENPGPYIPTRTNISSQQNYYGPNVFNEVVIDENVKMDDLQFDLGNEWSSMIIDAE